MAEDKFQNIKCNIVEVLEHKNYNFGSKFIVSINLKNMYKRFRKIEIGTRAFQTLSLKNGSEIVVYENLNKKGDFKINYQETFKLYNKKFIKYYNKK